MHRLKIRLLIINLLFFTFSSLWAQTELGIGLVSINFNDSTVLYLYSSTTDKQPAKIIEFFKDTSINSLNIRQLETQAAWLKPECFWIDLGYLSFRCKTQTNDWYQIIVNNDNGQTLWLKKTAYTPFYTWEAFLKRAFAIKRVVDKKQVIRIEPNEQSKEINYIETEDCFQVKSMKGDWIEIFTNDYCEDTDLKNKTKIKSGWIKWRDGNNLLIEYFITS